MVAVALGDGRPERLPHPDEDGGGRVLIRIGHGRATYGLDGGDEDLGTLPP